MDVVTYNLKYLLLKLTDIKYCIIFKNSFYYSTFRLIIILKIEINVSDRINNQTLFENFNLKKLPKIILLLDHFLYFAFVWRHIDYGGSWSFFTRFVAKNCSLIQLLLTTHPIESLRIA
jgi:hypothetical protein